MTTRGVTMAGLGALLAAGAGGAKAASPIAEVLCAPRAELVRKLEGQYGEVRRGVGLNGPDRVMELWSSPRSGDWTLVMSYASGTACIVAMGEDWQPLEPPPA
ncbi:hypothetical protein SAMN05444722_0115 [Rhodovulum sp. ES.010]|uniref:hypothetical protein n=1 Tax=Rhodovulum sp. ES.010 TaxID=1882821 RepID=UPI00092953A4|nr:hypothetical protein [Rhodovulum sp. ES.010]SIO01430.1 hypothetical protein SAMN05444722_0115 [Rhodovulum sp. ES.010]